MFWEYLQRAMASCPDSVIEDDAQRLSYAQFLQKSGRLASGLAARVASGGHCAVLCTRQLNTALLLAACWQAGITPTPLSFTYGDSYLQGAVTSLSPDAVLTDGEWKSSGAVPVLPLASLERGRAKERVQACVPGEIAAILCTSGTTGVPKGVMLTQVGLLCNVQDITRYFAIGPRDTMLIGRPLQHCAVFTGELLAGLALGVNIRFAGGSGYNPSALLASLANGVTVIGGTPTLFYQLAQLLQARGGQNTTLRAMAVSGERLTQSVGLSIRAAFPNTEIYSVYGLTEASPRVSCLPPHQFDSHMQSVGLPLASVQVKVADQYGRACPPFQEGELCVKAPSVMLGYYRNASLTKQKIQNGWLHTGDIAIWDARGLLYIKGRKDNMIIRAGLNIYPEEIENTLLRQEAVKEAVVFAVPANGGQGIGVKIVPTHSGFATEQATRLCVKILPKHLWPNQIQVVAALPKNASGKKLRHKQ